MNQLIKTYCKSYFPNMKCTNSMYESVKAMFEKFMLSKESKGLEQDMSVFFDEMCLDIECELESWD